MKSLFAVGLGNIIENERLYSTFISTHFYHLYLYSEFVQKVFEIENGRGEAVDVDHAYGIEEDAVGTACQ